MNDDDADDDRPVASSLSRRRLLALTSVGIAGGVAGCGGSGGDGTDTPAETADPTASPTEPPTDTAASEATATPSQSATATDVPTASPTDTATAAPQRFSVPEGGSEIDPGDGFADPAPWLEEEDVEVRVVSEPTLEAFDEAVNAAGPRVVVFETSGTIDLGEARFTVDHDKLYLAGQTAPSPGITLIRGGFWVNANDCVIQHLRVRPGDAGNESGWEPDTVRTADGSRNNVIDHCTATWSVDENVSPGYESTDTTFSNCIVAEALNEASHHKGPHAYGLLVGNGATGVALLGNVFAHNVARNPRLKAETESAVANNVMYHFNEAVNLDPSTVSSIVGNAFLRADEDDSNIEDGQAYVEDNITDGDANMVAGTEVYAGRAIWPTGFTAMDSEDVVEHDLAYAGARPADRTDNDQRLVDAVRNGEGDYIDSQDDVGGYPDLAENTHSLEIPESDLRGWLQAWAVAVEEPGVSPP